MLPGRSALPGRSMLPGRSTLLRNLTSVCSIEEPFHCASELTSSAWRIWPNSRFIRGEEAFQSILRSAHYPATPAWPEEPATCGERRSPIPQNQNAQRPDLTGAWSC
ncbi:hypothetical protein ANANG_G00114490 [Anguilla anguilla]|uniref:Uncharacterized protein n=1 Tax=Anguilla anguilla TaxID=7936 RepID=A0A9D3MCD8_ANGAN|nr:hypothetical protein ANANG_G00114490 [Anguilla anguilla]